MYIKLIQIFNSIGKELTYFFAMALLYYCIDYWVSRSKIKPKEEEIKSKPLNDREKKILSNLSAILILLYILGFFFGAYPLASIGVYTQQIILNLIFNPLYTIIFDKSALAVPMTFLLMILLIFPLTSLERFVASLYGISKEQIAVNDKVASSKYANVDILKFVTPLIIFFIFVFLSILNTYTIITPEGIINKRLFSIQSKAYGFSDISRIVYIDKYLNENNKLVLLDPRFGLFLKDGSCVSTKETTISNTPIEREYINYISKRTGLSVEQYGVKEGGKYCP
ncbi:MAG: hypothetical protein Q8O88_01580 [bacterium]|nr:hypothetical protein [bacterium]